MIKKLSKQIADAWGETLHVAEEDVECYQYGLELAFSTLFNVLWMILIALITGKTWAFLIYAAVYIPMRLCAGGYHASNHFRCILFSVASFVVCLGISYISLSYMQKLIVCTGIFIVSMIGLELIAPLESEKIPRSESQSKKYKKRLYLFQIILLGVLVFSIIKGMISEFVVFAFFSEASVLVSVTVGYIKSHRKISANK